MIRTEIENYGSKVQPKVDIEKVLATPADIIIAARNSSIQSRRQAHVVFNGVNDERQLSAIYSELTRRGGRRIHAKAGQYNFNADAVVRSGIWLTGDSWADDGALFKMANSANDDMFTNANTGTNTTDDWFGFYNLHLSGNNDSNTSGSCFKFGKIAVVGLDHLAIQDWAEDAIQIIGGTNGSNSSFSLFFNALEIADWGGAGIHLANTAASHFSNINFTGGGVGGGDYAIQLDGTLGVRNLNFSNIYAEMADVTAIIYLTEKAYNIHFTNVRLTGDAGDGIRLESGSVGSPAGNGFSNGSVNMAGATGTAAVYIKGTSNLSKFMNFYARHQGGVGYQVEGTVNTLIACIAEVCKAQGFYFLTAGARLNKAIGCTADRNGAGGATRYGFHINNSQHCQIIACSSGNSSGLASAGQDYGVYEDGTADFNQINQNTFKGNETGGASTVGAGTTTADNITQA